jgi:3-dehydroquinate synthase
VSRLATLLHEYLDGTDMTTSTAGTDTQVVVRVNLDSRSYGIWIGSDWLQGFGRIIRGVDSKSPNAMVFTSPRIGALHYERFERSLSNAGFTKIAKYEIPDGEEHKTTGEWTKGSTAIADNFPDTDIKPVVFNLGGGIVGDVGGFVAGTFWRNGLRYVQVPTTLLACVDCSVGGKVGVNLGNVKNQLGLFYQPHLVLVDVAFLDTLEDAEMRSGAAEVVKYGVACAEDVFDLLESHAEELLHRDRSVLQQLVKRCCEIKADIVRRDERDLTGERMLLNFGHTIGHAIETASNFAFRHGEAVAIGMLGATRMAVELGRCDQTLYDRLLTMVQRLGLQTTASNLDVEHVLTAMARDKKFVDGTNCFVLPTRLGLAKLEHNVPTGVVRRIVESCLS